ncbi:hypothetical protein C8R44DRAFT_973181 [Mycena epipterygia]|nr:hypothetical protein C8R44DRAFT_973181 [Mycena epipterygia]
MQLPRWIAFGLFLFSELDVSNSVAISVVRKSALGSDIPTSTTQFAVLPGQATAVLSSSTAIFTILSDSFPTPTPFAVLPGQATAPLLSSSTTIFTHTSAIATVIDGKSTTINSLSVGTSVTLVPVPTGQAASSSTSSSKTTVTIVGASIGVAVIILGLTVCIILRRRRAALRRRRASLQTKLSSGHLSESPEEINTPSDSHSGLNRASWEPYIARHSAQPTLTPANTISTRQLYISNQVNRAREKMTELEEVSTLLRSASHGSRTSDGRLSVPGTNPADTAGDPEDRDDKLERAIRQIEALNSRIHELERQRRSSWALGRSDEPPLGYTQ